jgi:hypothetical protein
MTVRPYEPRDFPQVEAWGKEYGTEYREHQFPKTGFIVDGVAAYFLYSTDSSCCWVENMIANKHVSKETRDEALDLIIQAILTEAEKLGFKIAYATTDLVPVMVRAIEYGAIIKPLQVLITKIIGPS